MERVSGYGAEDMQKLNRHGNVRDPQRQIARLNEELDLVRSRFGGLLSIMSSADNLDYVHKLAAAAKDGLKPGEMEWSFTSRLMEHRDIRGFCQTCGSGLNGRGCEVDIFAENCPAEIGILRYAGCSADA